MKLVRSLETKKGRERERLFVAEGPKVVGDLMHIMEPRIVFATRGWIEEHGSCPCEKIVELSVDELRKLSFLQHPQQVLALFPINGNEDRPLEVDDRNLYIALDGVQDPGNLGTIIRIADWFGITRIFCSRDTVDVYNPKVVQATMGSVARVDVICTDLAEMFASLPDEYPVYGTFLDGEDIYKKSLTSHGIVVMGNEGRGISPEIAGLVNRRLLIPNFHKGETTADSLNVAIATAIVCSEFRR